MKNDKQLKYVIKNTESDGNIIKAWERLQKIKTINLTPWQKRQYDKRRLYFTCYAWQYVRSRTGIKKILRMIRLFIILRKQLFYFRGNHKDELEEEKICRRVLRW